MSIQQATRYHLQGEVDRLDRILACADNCQNPQAWRDQYGPQYAAALKELAELEADMFGNDALAEYRRSA